MFMNRWLTRKEIVEVNGLTKEEEKRVFERLVPLDRSLGRYLEHDVDRVIGEVRRPATKASRADGVRRPGCRPATSRGLSIPREGDNPMNDAAALLEPLNGILGSYVQKVVEDAVQRLVPPPPVILPPPDPRLEMLTPQEAAVLMKRHVTTVLKWCRQKRIGHKVSGGKHYLISRHEVNEYVRGRLLVHGEKAR